MASPWGFLVFMLSWISGGGMFCDWAYSFTISGSASKLISDFALRVQYQGLALTFLNSRVYG